MEAATALGTATSDTFSAAGSRYWRRQNFDRAHQLTADLRRRFPESPIFADTYGLACYHRGEYQQAIETFAFAAKWRPRRADVRYHYGMALYKAGKIGKAKQELGAALELSQDFEGAAEAKEALAQMGRNSTPNIQRPTPNIQGGGE